MASTRVDPVGDPHYRRLEELYVHARCNQWYRPRIEVGHERCRVELDVDPRFHHAADAVHGSVYFKLLDDAAFFAANSLVPDVFVLTASFQLDLMRPVTQGILRAEGEVVQATKNRILASSALFDSAGRMVGRGSGSFMPSQIVLDELGLHERGEWVFAPGTS